MPRYMRFPGGRQKALTLSYDDGVIYDEKLIGIMQKHGIKGTFNLNSGCMGEQRLGRRFSKSECLSLYSDSGMEVALHGLRHDFLGYLHGAEAVREVFSDKLALEKMFGKVIRGMAYAYGQTSDEAVGVLKQCGIAYSRTTVSTEKFDIPTDWLRLPATCHHNNPHLMELANRFLAIGHEEKTPAWLKAPQLFYLWGHSYEFDDNDNWNVIEDFAALMGNNPEIWYATNIEIYDYTRAYNSLNVSADGTMFENPSAVDVFFNVNGKDCKIGAGSVLNIGE